MKKLMKTISRLESEDWKEIVEGAEKVRSEVYRGSSKHSRSLSAFDIDEDGAGSDSENATAVIFTNKRPKKA